MIGQYRADFLFEKLQLSGRGREGRLRSPDRSG